MKKSYRDIKPKNDEIAQKAEWQKWPHKRRKSHYRPMRATSAIRKPYNIIEF